MKLLNKREVILRKPFTDEYDIAHVVKEFEVTQYGVHVDDFDFHTSYFDSYDSKAEAEAAKVKREAWARMMGDNKYFSVTTRTVRVRRIFNIDMKKRNARARIKHDSLAFLNCISKRLGLGFNGIILRAVGLYYAKDAYDIPSLTEDYSCRAEKVLYVYIPDEDEYLLIFNPDSNFASSIKARDFKLNGGHVRWSDKSDFTPSLDTRESTVNWEELCFEFDDFPEF